MDLFEQASTSVAALAWGPAQERKKDLLQVRCPAPVLWLARLLSSALLAWTSPPAMAPRQSGETRADQGSVWTGWETGG